MLSSTSTNNEFSDLNRKSLSHGRLKRITSRRKFGRFDPPCCYQKPFFQLVTVQNQESVDQGYPSSAQKFQQTKFQYFSIPKISLLIASLCNNVIFDFHQQPNLHLENASICATTLCLSSTDNELSNSKRYTCAILLFSNTLLRLLSYNAALCYGTVAT